MPKNNAFDLLRVILATFVLVSHGYLIGGYGAEPLMNFCKNQTYLAEIGVMGFFALSGYLITGSFENITNPLVFIWHRILRIFPGLWACLLITAFLIAPAIYFIENTKTGGFPFFGINSAESFVVNNSLLKINQWSIGDILSGTHYQSSLNGSLWTLFPEFQCYLVTLTAGLFGLINRSKISLLFIWFMVYIIFIINVVLKISYGPTFLILSRALPLYLCYLTGSLIFIFRDRLIFAVKEIFFIILILIVLLKFGGFQLAAPILLPILCISIFSKFEIKFKYDISYGLYIYGFPVEILISRLCGYSINFFVYFFICFALTSLLGFTSNILIEKPFLKFKNIYSIK